MTLQNYGSNELSLSEIIFYVNNLKILLGLQMEFSKHLKINFEQCISKDSFVRLFPNMMFAITVLIIDDILVRAVSKYPKLTQQNWK